MIEIISYKLLDEGEYFITYFKNGDYKSMGIYQRAKGYYNTTISHSHSRYHLGKDARDAETDDRSYEASFKSIRSECLFFKLDEKELYDIIADMI